ncbi:2,5-dichloro-2,5-cyclohexadiene-1,4-diol dehydrogenase [Rosistilla ulvae]|uniref:2,5-dichloro-2,5-cyclohexadiene-1,4-diol dehydrogenase n=2 Tax=Rosistilla TaxID=2795779 RepID=A0A517LU16_9BACT|nr:MULTISPECIES: SDR family oxidoreductase [Rosistilla]QDS86123.1 2,5-dichloro-2,5-cyclohexadiene-1,4-diol dehydrogenase [Rosistilla ulvae]QDV71556.1 2,5-dichloro-2,5-cyclohexadiene-1,4-diol dehydrogenase [Rosistilla carotiformis]
MQDKNFVIVGGSHGIGAGIVRRCVERGAKVTVLSRGIGELADLPGVRHVPLDVTQRGPTADELPDSIDALAYCPGSINLGPLRSVTEQTLRDDFELNVVGAVRCMQACLAGLKSGASASVVLFSTVAVQQGLAMHTSVAAAKGAIEGLTRTWAAELAPKVRVNCIAPALTATQLSERLLATDEKRQAMAAMYPLGRHGEVDDIAAAAEFLLSDASSWITGQVLGVDGGLSSLRK